MKEGSLVYMNFLALRQATLRLSISDVLNTGNDSGEIGNLDRTTANFRTLSDTRAALLTLSLRFGKQIAG